MDATKFKDGLKDQIKKKHGKFFGCRFRKTSATMLRALSVSKKANISLNIAHN